MYNQYTCLRYRQLKIVSERVVQRICEAQVQNSFPINENRVGTFEVSLSFH